MNTKTTTTTTTTIDPKSCRHNVTRPGVDHIGPYVECLSCRQRGRRHNHAAQILSFGPAHEAIEERCAFCEAIASGIRIVVWDMEAGKRVYIDGVNRGAISRIHGTSEWMVRFVAEDGSIRQLANAPAGSLGIQMIAEEAGVPFRSRKTIQV